MSKIEINTRDLEVKTITRKDGSEAKIVQLKPSVAFDDDFISEMESLGVREFKKYEEQE